MKKTLLTLAILLPVGNAYAHDNCAALDNWQSECSAAEQAVEDKINQTQQNGIDSWLNDINNEADRLGVHFDSPEEVNYWNEHHYITWGNTSVSDDLLAQLHDSITGHHDTGNPDNNGSDNNGDNNNNNADNNNNPDNTDNPNTDPADNSDTSLASVIGYADAVSDHAEAAAEGHADDAAAAAEKHADAHADSAAAHARAQANTYTDEQFAAAEAYARVLAESSARYVDQGVQDAKRYTDHVAKGLQKQIDRNNKAIKRLGASAQATANLHYNANRSGYAVSVGDYRGETALAGGLQFRAGNHSAVTVQGSYDAEAFGGSVGLHGDW
ncbi:YadA C-terminal domain-containing protein [Enterobacter sp.]|uniref:YadA C-terminal domain-containing protein n=1 Tax=Enterobacter sp. TaxID=42895 RepID=UPI00296F2121|nr:YadA C-terminal domain-containing protein [Enterobacter sp.]